MATPADENLASKEASALEKGYSSNSDVTVTPERSAAAGSRANQPRASVPEYAPQLRAQGDRLNPRATIHPDILMHERGVYAIQDIPVGTRVISEEPLILVKGREINDAELMDAQYHRLPDDKQKWVEGLAPGLFEQFHKLSQMIDRLFPWLEKIDKKPFDERTTQERRNFSYIAPLVLHMLQCWRVASRFTAHCIEFTNLDAEYLPKVAPDVAAKGLFKEATRVRHSCVPNMYHTWNPVINAITYHTTKNIRKGEELTVSFIGTRTWYFVAEDREKFLRSGSWREGCPGCAACGNSHVKVFKVHKDAAGNQTIEENKMFMTYEDMKVFKAHQDARAKLQVDTSALNQTLEEITLATNPPDDFDIFVPPVPSIEDMRNAEATCLDVLKTLRETGCEDMELARWRGYLIKEIFSRMQGKAFAAVAHAKVSEQIAQRCMGDDNPEIEVYKQLVTLTKAEMQMEKVLLMTGMDVWQETWGPSGKKADEEPDRETENDSSEVTEEESDKETEVKYKGKGKEKMI